MSTKQTLIIVIIALIVIAIVWYLSYFLMNSYGPNSNSQKGEKNIQSNAPDSTVNISSDINQLPEDSSINSEMNNLDLQVDGF